MEAPDVLGRLQSLGLTLSTDGNNLMVEPKAAITAEARALIRQHKSELLARLKVSPGNTARGWLVRYQDGSVIPVFILLADGTCPTRSEVLRDYPGAIEATPTPEMFFNQQ